MGRPPDYYQILDVRRDADELTLKTAYRKLAVQYHPDRNPGSRLAEAKFKEAAEAYNVLSDPLQRSNYDKRIPGPSAGFPSAAVPSVRVPWYAVAAATAVLFLICLFGLGRLLSKNASPRQVVQPWSPSIDVADPAPPAPAQTRTTRDLPKKHVPAPAGVVDIVRGARPVTQPAFDYPPTALRDRISGLVELQITIGENGSVQNLRVLSGHPLLTQGLREAVSQWTFRPMRVNGLPSPLTTEMTIRFDITR